MSLEKAGKYACFEFERRFLLTELPKELLGSKDYKIIQDKYFFGTRLRLRTVSSPDGKVLDRKFTQKYISENSDFSKTTITNLYLNESEAALIDQLPGLVLTKKRYKLNYKNTTFSVDEFEGKHSGLVLAEIEFENEEQMNKFSIPFTTWQDVTLEMKYSGGFLALNSTP